MPWVFSPMLDLGRQLLWLRLSGTFGDDSYFTTVVGVAATRRYEGLTFSITDSSFVGVREPSCLDLLSFASEAGTYRRSLQLLTPRHR